MDVPALDHRISIFDHPCYFTPRGIPGGARLERALQIAQRKTGAGLDRG